MGSLTDDVFLSTTAGFDVIDDDPYSTDTIDPSKHPDFAGRERNKPIHARSLRDAFEICEDGDRILLLRACTTGAALCATWTKGS